MPGAKRNVKILPVVGNGCTEYYTEQDFFDLSYADARTGAQLCFFSDEI